MQIKLSQLGPPMWYLGEPKNIRVSLTFSKPGPVEIDFASFTKEEQVKVLVGIRDGQLESDVTFQELYHQWANHQPAVPPEPDNPYIEPIQARLNEARLKLEASRREKEDKGKQRCLYLLAKSVRAIKAAITSITDRQLIHMMLLTEKAGKARKGVTAALEKKMRQLIVKEQMSVAKKVSKATKAQLKQDPAKETIVFDVVESEQETVVLTPEDLITTAAKEL